MKKKSIFKYEFYGEPEKFLIAAGKTVGISLDYISKIVADRSGNHDNLNSIDVGDWCYLCALLKLDVGCISYGYSTIPHERRIGEAIEADAYHLPFTFEVKKIWQIYKKELKNNELIYHKEELFRKVQGNNNQNVPDQNDCAWIEKW